MGMEIIEFVDVLVYVGPTLVQLFVVDVLK